MYVKRWCVIKISVKRWCVVKLCVKGGVSKRCMQKMPVWLFSMISTKKIRTLKKYFVLFYFINIFRVGNLSILNLINFFGT